MQTFKAYFHLVGLILLSLFTACAWTEMTETQPTPIVARVEAGLPTPTLITADTALIHGGAHGGKSLGDPYIPELGNTGYDVQRYNLQLSLDPASSAVRGTTTIQAVATGAKLAQFSLDFIGFEIEAALVNGAISPFSREAGKLTLTPPQPLAGGEQFEVTVTYTGAPVRQRSAYVGFIDALGLQFIDDQTIFAVAEPDGARYWFPANDHPRDKALFRFEITVPAGLTAVANGRLVTTETNGAASTFTWEHNHPMATYLALVAVGPYERIDAVSPGGIPLRHYTFPDSRENFEAAVAVTGEAIDWLSQLLGPYPFEEFGYVAADMPGASMETQTMVLLSSQLTGQRTAVHELAHMWFGNWVSLDSWQEMWRNEGFATYITLMWENRGRL